jgi:3',5'-cyclic AMP phosphodiesterase CpdA
MAAQGQGSADDRGGESIVRSLDHSTVAHDGEHESNKFRVRSKIIAISILLLVYGSIAYAAQDQQITQKLAVLEKIQGRFTFVVIGDNRSGDDTYQKIVSLAMERKPDFIINNGDMIVKPGNKKEWTNFWALSKPITVPYFLTVGNHDVNPRIPLSEKTYKAQVDLPGNELYYSFVAGNSLFIVLDSYLDDQEKRITGEQFTWLETVLSNTTQKHRFVFLHHPLYTDLGKGHHAHDSLDKYPESRDRLESLFAKHKVDAVFAGHEHYYQRRLVEGIVHIITGGGGAPMYEREEDGGFFHFVRVTVDGDKVSGEVIDTNGKIRDRF